MTESNHHIERRYEGNVDAWSLNVPSSNINSSRIVSTRSQTLRQLNETNTKQKLNDLYLGIKAKLKALIIDQWRRATKSGNDPYVKISLKPTPNNDIEDYFCTLPILGGGTNVAFDPVYDNAEYTFLCRKDINALKRKYLKISVFDQETGTSDRLIGTAHILLSKINQNIDETQYAEISLYGDCNTGYQWAGTIELSATFKKINLDEVEEITYEINQRIEQNIKNKLGLINRLSNKLSNNNNNNTRNRSATDQIMLNRMKSKSDAKYDALKEIQEQYKREQQDKKERDEVSQTRYVQGLIVNVALFISLILSGTLFLGAMNEYEVFEQRKFMKENYSVSFSIIDSFRWSVVSVSTVGYGDFYPQTTGARLFATFFIIFGVSLLARILNTILDRVSQNYQTKRLTQITHRKSVTIDSLQEFDEDGDGVITNYEFLKTMLLRRGDTTKQVIDEIMDLFDSYDQDKSGEIEVEEIRNLIHGKEKQNEQNEQKSDSEKSVSENKKFDHDKFEKLDIMKSATNFNLDLSGIDDEDDDDDDDEYEYALTVQVRGLDNLKEADDLIAAEDSFWSFITGWLIFCVYLTIGASIFSLVESANFGDMLWMFVVTTCTVGYGDVYPVTKLGKVLNGFFISISVVLFVSTFSSTFDYIYARQEALVKQKAMNKKTMDDVINKFPLLSQALGTDDKHITN